jgi:hypothetical protein
MKMNDRPWNFDDDDFYEIDSPKAQFEFLLRYAVLAPSGHNTQPWKFEITSCGINVVADYSRRLTRTDPHDRELLMSVGAAIANLRVAAAHFGFTTRVLFSPVREDLRWGAFIAIRETCDPDPKLSLLFHAIKARRTNRRAFDTDTIDPETLSPVLDFVDEHPETFHVVFPRDSDRAADLIALADRLQMDDDLYRDELSRWVRSNPERATDGLSASALGFPSALAGGASLVLKHVDIGLLQSYRDHDLAARAPMLLIVSSYDDPISLIKTGELLELFLLTLTDRRLQYSFLNAPVQVAGLRERVASLVGTQRPPQLILRIGMGRPLVETTPRRPLADVVS